MPTRLRHLPRLFRCRALGVLGALSVLPSPGPAQQAASAAAPDEAASVEQLLSAIEAEQNRAGLPSEALGRRLLALGRLYQASAEYDLAAVQLNRALEVIRMHNGLSSLAQVPALREMMLNAEHRGDFAYVQLLEERLVGLAAANADDERAADLYAEIADRQVAAYQRFREHGTPFNIDVNPSVRAAYRVSLLFNERAAALAELERGRTNYTHALGILRAQGYGRRFELADLETKLVRTYYLEATLKGAMPPGVAHRLGEQSYLRVLAEKEAGSEPAPSVARTLVELADWYLLFDYYAQARERYRQAYDLLAAGSDTVELMTELFAPEVPVMLPVFVTNPLAERSSDESDAYLNVVIEVSEYGQSEAKEISDDDGDLPRDLENRVERLFARQRFRPRFVDGELSSRARLSVRYPIDAVPVSAAE